MAGAVADGGCSAGELPVGAVAVLNRGTAFLDRIADALTWSLEIAEFGSGLVGTPVSVWTSVYGQMGAITWIAVHPDLAPARARQHLTDRTLS